MGNKSLRELDALRARLAQEQHAHATELYNRHLAEDSAAVQAMRDETASQRQSNGGSTPDHLIDAQIASTESHLKAVADSLRTKLGL